MCTGGDFAMMVWEERPVLFWVERPVLFSFPPKADDFILGAWEVLCLSSCNLPPAWGPSNFLFLLSDPSSYSTHTLHFFVSLDIFWTVSILQWNSSVQFSYTFWTLPDKLFSSCAWGIQGVCQDGGMGMWRLYFCVYFMSECFITVFIEVFLCMPHLVYNWRIYLYVEWMSKLSWDLCLKEFLTYVYFKLQCEKIESGVKEPFYKFCLGFYKNPFFSFVTFLFSVR